MKTTKNEILIINGGSSSIKFASYHINNSIELVCSGKMEKMGSENTILNYTDAQTSGTDNVCVDTSGNIDASNLFINWLETRLSFKLITATGHRVVHGLKHTQKMIITSELLQELKAIRP